MTEYKTYVAPVNDEHHAYCDCGWRDLWLPNARATYDSATDHKRNHEREES